MLSLKHKAQEMYKQGFCVLESVYSRQECQRIHEIMAKAYRAEGGQKVDDHVVPYHPFLKLEPEMGEFFGKQIVYDTMAEVFQDEVRLAHSGAAMSNEIGPMYASQWHHHYGWPLPDKLERDKPERVLCNIYLEGLSCETGPLIVLPRKLNAPIVPLGAQDQSWPGEVEVYAPAGSAVIFDTALWHAAKRGTRAGLRRALFGGHYQGWHNPRPHPEDNQSDSPALASYKQRLPVLRMLIDGPI